MKDVDFFDLNSCEYCGSFAVLEMVCGENWRVKCPNNACPAQPKSFIFPTQEEAVSKWNGPDKPYQDSF